MTKGRRFWKIPAMLVVGLALVLTGCDSDISPDTGWQVRANCEDSTTALIFEFNAPVRDLTVSEIRITPSDALANSTLEGAGRQWTLYTNIMHEGEITVSINRRGVSSRPSTVDVSAISWSALTSAYGPITLLFDVPVANLQPAQINLIDQSNMQTIPVALTGSGARWVAEPQVQFTGTATIAITRPGVLSLPETGSTLIVGATSFTPTIRSSNPNIVELVFGASVNLDLSDITVVTAAGAPVELIYLHPLTADGTHFDLEFWNPGGALSIMIDRAGITGALQPVGTVGTPVPALALVAPTPMFATMPNRGNVIRFTFNRPVMDLIDDQIDVTDGTGSVTRGDLRRVDATGTTWELDVTVERAGDVLVTLTRPDYWTEGTASPVRTVAVVFANTVGIYPIMRNISQPWEPRIYRTEYLEFVFNYPVALTAYNIIIEDVSADLGIDISAPVLQDNLSGAGNRWLLSIDIDDDSASGDMAIRFVDIPGMPDHAIPSYTELRRSVVRDTTVYSLEIYTSDEDTEVTESLVVVFTYPVNLALGHISIEPASPTALATGSVVGLTDLGNRTRWELELSTLTGESGPMYVTFTGRPGLPIDTDAISGMDTVTIPIDVVVPVQLVTYAAETVDGPGTDRIRFTFSTPVNLTEDNFEIAPHFAASGAEVADLVYESNRTVWLLYMDMTEAGGTGDMRIDIVNVPGLDDSSTMVYRIVSVVVPTSAESTTVPATGVTVAIDIRFSHIVSIDDFYWPNHLSIAPITAAGVSASNTISGVTIMDNGRVWRLALEEFGWTGDDGWMQIYITGVPGMDVNDTWVQVIVP